MEEKLSIEDFNKAVEALMKANVPEPYYAYFSEENPFYKQLKEWENESTD